MNAISKPSRLGIAALGILYALGNPATVLAAPTSLADEPLATGLTGVPPNVMFILDDSGSMASDYTPDYVSDQYCRTSDSLSSSSLEDCNWGDPLYASPQFNSQYYNPAIRYKAPFHPDDVGKAEDDNTRVYPSYNDVGSNQKWNSVKTAPYSSSSTRSLLVANQDAVACNVSSSGRPTQAEKFNTSTCKPLTDGALGATGKYLYPNPRNSSSQTSSFFYNRVSRTGDATYNVRPYFYLIDQVLWCKNRYTAKPASGTSASRYLYGKGTADTAAADYANNPCFTRRGTIGGTNYQYPRFGTLAHTTTGTGADNNTNNSTNYTGLTGFTRHDIFDAGGGTLPASYPAKSASRTECTGAQCTYTQEMTNYANWYAYYRTRLTAMKTAAGRAFENIQGDYRVGFITICPRDGASCNSAWSGSVGASRYLKIDGFDSTQKLAWYNKLYSITTNSYTPLRTALARVGQMYAGRLDTGLTSGIPVADDPVQESCQQNFAILTTDGYWNGAGGQKKDGTAMDNQDHDIALTPRPFYDGPVTASDTLADTAIYYYVTDLRPSMINNVPTTAKDTATHQHMTTFTLGLGVDGRLGYRSDYETALSGDFYNIKQGGGTNWPAPAPGADTAVDDLWHAAVNGRGKYFSAQNPELLTQGLQDTLTEVGNRIGAGAAAATSSLRPSAGDQLAFTAQYETGKWAGDLKARTIDVNATSSTFGQVSTRDLWSAQTLLDAKAWDTRRIYTFDPADTAGDKLKFFCWDNTDTGCTTNGTGLTTGEQAYFDPTRLNQYGLLTPDQRAQASGRGLVNYLRGDSTYENTGGGGNTDLLRLREHKLGDIVNAQPVYVKKPPFDYADGYYGTFKSNNAGRAAMVFVGANDGMLHAFAVDPDNNPYYQTGGFATAATSDDTFSAGTNDGGNEAWAYLPAMLLPKVYQLAQTNTFAHQYYVDGSPVVSDVCSTTPCASASNWRTILVAGLNKGGRGYYALDITDPLNPKGLWEWSVTGSTACLTDAQANMGTSSTYYADCNLGYTYSTPIVTKWLGSMVGNDGRWVVLVTSGYNNYNPGDGNGYLYMLDALSGKILGRIGTGVGSGGTAAASYTDADPSGLGKINLFIEDSLTNNTGGDVYGGDLKGNMWRFRVGDANPANWTKFKLATAMAPDGSAQPITVRPELGKPRDKRAVFVGTGRYLGTTDADVTQTQTIYGIKDNQTTDTFVPTIGASSRLVTRAFGPESTLPDGTITRSIASGGTALDFASSTQDGFRIDLPTGGERVNVDLALQVGTVVVESNLPEKNSCSAGGSGWENYIDFETGFSIPAVGGVGGAKKFTGGLIVGSTIVQLGDRTVAITTTSDTKQTTSDTTGHGAGAGSFTGKRSSWRELITE